MRVAPAGRAAPATLASRRPGVLALALILLGVVVAAGFVWQLTRRDRMAGAPAADRLVTASTRTPAASGDSGSPSRTGAGDPAESPEQDATAAAGTAPSAPPASDDPRESAVDLFDAAWATVDAVTARLLALQDGDGGWRTDDPRWGRRGATALALLFFLGQGQQQDDSAAGAAMQRALSFLESEASDGEHAYADAAVALALSELAALTGAAPDTPILQAAADATAGLDAAELPGGGWSAGSGDLVDVGASGLAIMALTSRRLLTGDDGGEALARARAWAAGTDPAALALDPDETLGDERAAMAFTVLSRIFLHVSDPQEESMQLAAELIVAAPPPPTDHLGAYLASMALYQVGGAPWMAWREHLGTRFELGAPADPAEAALLGLSACIARRFPVAPSSR